MASTIAGAEVATPEELDKAEASLLFASLALVCSTFLFVFIIHHKLKFRYIPESVLTLSVGVATGAVLRLGVSTDVTNELLNFNDSVLFCVLLPPIIFNSGYSMDHAFLFTNFTKVCVLGFVGPLVTTLVIGVPTYLAGMVMEPHLTFVESLAFGCLMSATDPLLTRGLFTRLRIDPVLKNLVEAEGVLIDAVAIVLFKALDAIIVNPEPTTTNYIVAALNFVGAFGGSALLGLFLGGVSALTFKLLPLRQVRGLELTMLAVFCYMPFMLAEALRLSGIVAILFTGVMTRRYVRRNLSEEPRAAFDSLVALIVKIAETVIFLGLGTSLFGFKFDNTFVHYVGFVLITLLLVVISRPITIYPLAFALNCGSRVLRRGAKSPYELTWPRKHILCVSGVRGAIAYALALVWRGSNRDSIILATITVVYVGTVFVGMALLPLIKCLGVQQLSKDEFDNRHALAHDMSRSKVVQLDQRFLTPLLCVDDSNGARGAVHETVAKGAGLSETLLDGFAAEFTFDEGNEGDSPELENSPHGSPLGGPSSMAGSGLMLSPSRESDNAAASAASAATFTAG
jgi:sodium/hydrogen exchanger 8